MLPVAHNIVKTESGAAPPQLNPKNLCTNTQHECTLVTCGSYFLPGNGERDRNMEEKKSARRTTAHIKYFLYRIRISLTNALLVVGDMADHL